jgi:hexosaminidase
MILPRLAAMSEVQWMDANKKDYEEFLERLPRLISHYNKLDYTYATHVFDVTGEFIPNFDTNALEVEFTTIDDADIYYTLDGSDPSESSIKYEGVFTINDNTEIKAAAIRDGVKSKILKEVINVNKATYKPIELLTTPARNYEFTGAGLLVDGIKGKSTNYRTGRWIGFQGEDLVAVIDMLQPIEISSLEINNAVVTGDWIFDTSEISIESSNDGNNYSTVATKTIIDENDEHWAEISTHQLSFEPDTARYFKVSVKCSTMPDWHPGNGRRAYIFVDEIKLN